MFTKKSYFLLTSVAVTLSGCVFPAELDTVAAERDIAIEERNAAVVEAEKLQSDLDTADKGRAAADAEADRLQSKLDDADAEARRLQSDLDTADAEARRLRSELDVADAEARRFRSELDAADEEARRFRSELDAADEETDRLQLELDIAAAEAERLRLGLGDANSEPPEDCYTSFPILWHTAISYVIAFEGTSFVGTEQDVLNTVDWVFSSIYWYCDNYQDIPLLANEFIDDFIENLRSSETEDV